MEKGSLSGNQKIFIDIANNDYWTFVEPKTTLKGMAETLMRIKGNALVDYKETQSKLMKVLNDIAREKKLQDSEELKYFIEARERLSFTYRVNNGVLIREDSLRSIPYPHWYVKLTREFIDFLSDPQNDIRKINKCQNESCGRYYIAGKLDTRQKYCSEKCGNAARRLPPEKLKKYMQERRKKEKQKRKSMEETSIKKEQIQRFIKAGYSQKEAEREWLRVCKEMIKAPKEFDLVKRDKPVKRETSRFT